MSAFERTHLVSYRIVSYRVLPCLACCGVFRGRPAVTERRAAAARTARALGARPVAAAAAAAVAARARRRRRPAWRRTTPRSTVVGRSWSDRGSSRCCAAAADLAAPSASCSTARRPDRSTRSSPTSPPPSSSTRAPSRNYSRSTENRYRNKLGDTSFLAVGPRLWNDLPPGLRRPGLTVDSFRQSLKSHLFGDRSA